MEVLKTIVTVLCTGGVFAFLEFLIRRRDEKKGAMSKVITRLDRIEKRQDTSERDSCRTQLLILLNHYPANAPEIMKLAEHYASIGGNWYMSSLFDKWLEKQGLERPSWWETDG